MTYIYYLKVRWEGWGEEHDTWEPRDNLLPQLFDKVDKIDSQIDKTCSFCKENFDDS